MFSLESVWRFPKDVFRWRRPLWIYMIISIGKEGFGYLFSLANRDEVLEEIEYLSGEEMLNYIRVEGKSLKEIWNDFK